MTRLRPIIGCLLALVVAGGLTACGETRGTGSAGTATTTTAPKTTTTAPKPKDYRNMDALAASTKEKLDKGKTATHNGPVKEVSCTANGKQSAVCIVTYRAPPKVTYKVTIAQDGRSYIASPTGSGQRS